MPIDKEVIEQVKRTDLAALVQAKGTISRPFIPKIYHSPFQPER
jgi:hypothetical protein